MDVVSIRACVAGIKCRDAIVELTQRADSNGVVAIVSMREEHGLAAIAAQKIVQKLQLVETVLRQMQRVSRRLQINRRRNSDRRAERPRRCRAEFARQLEDEGSAHR